ncbi:hypothetical protein L0F63_001716 [Massospora cicadina]|nr:hypothetical protein L0F63_001716 [Massospora cicadina]
MKDVWGSSAPPPSVFCPAGKRVWTGSNSPPTDLALHLARVHPSRPHPLALPRSAICYCLRVDYERLFPYANTTLVVSFANLPSHLPPQVLYDQLVAGLMAYGTQPNLIFAIPSGAEHLAAPWATATIIPHHPTIAQQIPLCASVAAAPDHFFWAQVNNGSQICSLCFGLDHAKRAYPQANSAAAASEPPSGGSVWGALLPLPPSNLIQWAHMENQPLPKTSSLTLPPKSTPANQSNAWTTIGTQAAAHSPNPTHPNSNATIPVNQNPWDLLAETEESGNVLISKHTGQPLCQGDYGWAEFFLPDFDETPTPRHFAPLPNTAPFQSDHQLALAVVASPHCLKLRTAVAQSVAQLQHGLPTLFFPPTSLNLPAVKSQNYSMMLKLWLSMSQRLLHSTPQPKSPTTVSPFSPNFLKPAKKLKFPLQLLLKHFPVIILMQKRKTPTTLTSTLTMRMPQRPGSLL